MLRHDVIQVWGRMLEGRKPLLSIEITREFPSHSACFTLGEQHLGGARCQRQDVRGPELIRGVLDLIDRYRPLKVSLVGNDPLVRYRELEELVPQLVRKGIFVQIVTNAFRVLPPSWAGMPRVQVCVSIEGLPPEHDARCAPVTYDRILRNIAGQRVTLQATITAAMLARPSYLRELLDFWTPRPEIERVWFSLHTPQKGEQALDILDRAQRRWVIEQLRSLRPFYPKLDMDEDTIGEFASPPQAPRECVLAQTTETISADLATRITPCPFGGNPDCSQCGCLASMQLAGTGRKKLLPGVSVGNILLVSNLIGRAVARAKAEAAGVQAA